MANGDSSGGSFLGGLGQGLGKAVAYALPAALGAAMGGPLGAVAGVASSIPDQKQQLEQQDLATEVRNNQLKNRQEQMALNSAESWEAYVQGLPKDEQMEARQDPQGYTQKKSTEREWGQAKKIFEQHPDFSIQHLGMAPDDLKTIFALPAATGSGILTAIMQARAKGLRLTKPYLKPDGSYASVDQNSRQEIPLGGTPVEGLGKADEAEARKWGPLYGLHLEHPNATREELNQINAASKQAPARAPTTAQQDAKAPGLAAQFMRGYGFIAPTDAGRRKAYRSGMQALTGAGVSKNVADKEISSLLGVPAGTYRALTRVNGIVPLPPGGAAPGTLGRPPLGPDWHHGTDASGNPGNWNKKTGEWRPDA